MTLQDTMSNFRTLKNDHFTVRMTPREAELYGPRVLELLEEARGRLCAKYEPQLTWPVLVEIFHEQKDFAVRTFGMPENHGFLGVCFGPVITANSPASRPGQRFNWEAMLWHEFCHVITLQISRNKMPRWLSEGISVYEERQANPAWGERLVPRYREMILEGELAPVSRLSAAFLAPRSAVHLQFAYYQSSLVVQFLAERYGFKALTAILRDLGEGLGINEAIQKHTAPMAKIEKEFAAFAKKVAEQMAPGLDWEKPSLESRLSGAAEVTVTPGRARSETRKSRRLGVSDLAWTLAHPTNFWVMTRQAGQFVEEKEWSKAKPILEKLVELYPDFTGPDSAYRMLAATHRALGETNVERQVLAEFAERDCEAPDAYLRLMELAADTQDWPAVVLNARRYLAVDPLVAPPYRFLALASEKTGELKTAIAANRALLQLDPPNPATVNFHLAQLLHRANDPGARLHVLKALEDAPRYREALRLLLELGASPSQANPTTNSPPAPGRVVNF
jgi:tetratricopeptide (TPR) repeat protein